MTYDVHITRKDEWSDEDGPEITLDEWRAVVAADPELREDGFAEVRTPDGSTLRVEHPGLTAWTGRPGATADGGVAWISYSDGELVVSGPDRAVLEKVIDLAERLGANVQGDEGEHYDRSNLPDDPSPQPSDPPKRRRFFGR